MNAQPTAAMGLVGVLTLAGFTCQYALVETRPDRQRLIERSVFGVRRLGRHKTGSRVCERRLNLAALSLSFVKRGGSTILWPLSRRDRSVDAQGA
jgi:hypothetical protein